MIRSKATHETKYAYVPRASRDVAWRTCRVRVRSSGRPPEADSAPTRVYEARNLKTFLPNAFFGFHFLLKFRDSNPGHQFSMAQAARVSAAVTPPRGPFSCSRRGRSRTRVRSRVTANSTTNMTSPAGPEEGKTTFVWYASFGSNILSERFACYLRGGRIEGMIKDMPGSRDATLPTEWMRWDNLPHRLFFAHSSPTWDGGGVAFVDLGENFSDDDNAKTPVQNQLGTSYRLYRVTLEQFNDVLAQENGMVPGEDDGCVELTPEEAKELSEKWNEIVADNNNNNNNNNNNSNGDKVKHGGLVDGNRNSDASVPNTGPPGKTRAPSTRWYGYVKCIGSVNGEPVLTFTCDTRELAKFRSGALLTNEPSRAYYDVIRKGLVQTGMSESDASAYLDARVATSVRLEGSAPVR